MFKRTSPCNTKISSRPFELPLVEVKFSNNCIVLYGVVSPDISPMSGVLYAFVTRTKFPKSRFVTPALIVVTSLAFCISLNVIAVFSISYP